MAGMLNNLNITQSPAASGSKTTREHIATVRMADMIYVVFPNFLDNRILFSKVIG